MPFTPMPKPDKTIKKKRKTRNPRSKLITECDTLVREILWKTESVCFVTGADTGRFSSHDNPYGLAVGHFCPRKVYGLRWDLRNCHLQSAPSNSAHRFNPLPYAAAIASKLGVQVLNDLNQAYQEYKITGKTMPTWQIQEKKEELQATLDELNGERATI